MILHLELLGYFHFEKHASKLSSGLAILKLD
jgi:hypothetical protein